MAGLKAVDNTLREAAAIDGANERQTFFRIVFPVMRPINIIVLVITVIEALRAFDLVWVINKGRNGLELIATLVTANVVGEASRIGFGSAMATILARGVSPWRLAASSEAMISAAAPSFTPEALPAVTVPGSRNGVFRRSSISSVVSGRGCSSLPTIVSPLRVLIETGTISRAKKPLPCAFAAFC